MGLFDRFRRRADDPAPVPAPAPAPGADLAAYAAERMRPGFLRRADAEAWLVEVVEDDPEGWPGLSEADALATVARVWRELAAEQAGWADEGDYERVRQAFGELASDGVVARMDFTCCQTCGHAEIGDGRAEGDWGYTFFHEQDSERLGPGDCELFLAFGAFGPTPDVSAELLQRAQDGDEAARAEAITRSEVAVARRVVTALTRHGLAADWDGTHQQRIRVVGLDWRKRLPAD